jgi:hypothetical protein
MDEGRNPVMIRTTDSKGRVTLGRRFANKPVIIEDISDTEVKVSLARVIPEREMWLYQNPEALDLVQRGLAQAEARQFADSPPDLDADEEWARELED